MTDNNKLKLPETTEAPPVKVIPPVDVQFRDVLMELVYDVSQGAKLAEAKNKLHAWVEELPQTEKDILYTKASAVAKRIRDIADSLTSETPSLLTRMVPSQDNI